MLASYGNTHDIKSKIIESVQLDFIHIYKEKGHELCVSLLKQKLKDYFSKNEGDISLLGYYSMNLFILQ